MFAYRSQSACGPQAENIPVEPDADNAAEGSMLNK